MGGKGARLTQTNYLYTCLWAQRKKFGCSLDKSFTHYASQGSSASNVKVFNGYNAILRGGGGEP